MVRKSRSSPAADRVFWRVGRVSHSKHAQKLHAKTRKVCVYMQMDARWMLDGCWMDVCAWGVRVCMCVRGMFACALRAGTRESRRVDRPNPRKSEVKAPWTKNLDFQ